MIFEHMTNGELIFFPVLVAFGLWVSIPMLKSLWDAGETFSVPGAVLMSGILFFSYSGYITIVAILERMA